MEKTVTIDIEMLKKDLISYFGTAMMSGNPMAMMELEEVNKASDYELVNIAVKNGFDLNNYVVNAYFKKR